MIRTICLTLLVAGSANADCTERVVSFSGSLHKQPFEADFAVEADCPTVAATVILLPKNRNSGPARQAHADEYDVTVLDALGIADDCEHVVTHPDRHADSDVPHAHSFCDFDALPGDYTIHVQRFSKGKETISLGVVVQP